MSTTAVIFVFTFFLFFYSGIGDNNNGDTNTIIDRYVPLGHHFNFTCDAYQRIKQKYLQIYRVQWFYRRPTYSILIINNPNSSFIYDLQNYFLIGYDFQRDREGILECHVSYKNSLSNDMHVESSVINLKVQDCNENIDSNVSHALRNPCQFGQCKVVSAKLNGIKHEKLYCDCVEQYTGLYCDVEKIGTWWRETLYYSSTFGHFLCTGIIFLCFYCFDRSNSKERISLKEDVPDLGRIRDQIDILYPAARKRKPKPPTEQPQQAEQQQQNEQIQPENNVDIPIPLSSPPPPPPQEVVQEETAAPVTPQKIIHVTPQKNNPVTPQKIILVTPQKINPGIAPQENVSPVVVAPQEEHRQSSQRSQQRSSQRGTEPLPLQRNAVNDDPLLPLPPPQQPQEVVAQASTNTAVAPSVVQPTQENEVAISPSADRVKAAYLTLINP